MVAPFEGSRVLAYTTYNHLYHPRAYIKPEDGGLLEEYRYLTEHVSMWDVAVERQIQVKGPDAADFVNLLITRDVHAVVPPMQARYVILCNQHGGVINDPVLLRVADDEFWLSISDSDVLLWAQGVNANAGYNVEINEIDVAPVQIQGPKSAPLMEKMFGSHVRNIPYYGLIHETLNGHAVTISRTGFSAEVGFEIYLHDAMLHADDVWPYILEQGAEFNLRVIAPSHIRRLEAGILSYGQDLDIENNPYEVRLGWQVDLNKSDFIGKDALARIKEEGVKQRLVGLKVGGEPITWYNEDFYLVKDVDAATTWATSPAPSGRQTSGRTLPSRSCLGRTGGEAPAPTCCSPRTVSSTPRWCASRSSTRPRSAPRRTSEATPGTNRRGQTPWPRQTC